MFEKVNPSHPDKVADRIAGAIVDLAYKKNETPKIAVEVLVGHGTGLVIIESSESFEKSEIQAVVDRIVGYHLPFELCDVPQDCHLSNNQAVTVKCGDNGIFKGVPSNADELYLSRLAKEIYDEFQFDGKYLINGKDVTICQSNAKREDLVKFWKDAVINPLGYWTGGINVDSGATNRKLGSDMGRGVTGGGLHGKDLSKADVTLNICAYLEAQETGNEVEYICSIGDEFVNGKPYSEYVARAKAYIEKVGGFEKFAEWGLI